MGDLYEADIHEWSDQQAALLRRVAAGERVTSADLDWPNIIEAIESVGRDQRKCVESLLVQALAHTLKAAAWPLSREVPGWLAEARRFRDDAASRFTNSMRQYIDVERIHARALRAMPDTIHDQPPLPVPITQKTLDELLNDD